MLFRSNDTATTEIYTDRYTLSLHDALPIRVRRAIEEATSTAEAAFRREWVALESVRQRLGD